MLSAIFGALGQPSENSVKWVMTIVASGVIWAFALARPLVEIVPAACNALRWFVWRKEHGRWYAYEGRRMRVFTVDGAPWIAVRDIALKFGIWIERNVLIQFRLARERGLRLPRT